MGYRAQGLVHVHLHQLLTRLRHQASGQGTVEYVALLFLVGAVFAAIVTAGRRGGDFGVTDKITKTLKGALDGVGSGR